MKTLQVGDKAPNFKVPDKDGKIYAMSDFIGQWVLLYFYPKDNTPGCTKQACAFRDTLAEFKKANAVVLGVSLDSVESHRRFIQKYTLPFTLLSDSDAAVSKTYGVYKLKKMYGREFWGIERSTFLIDLNGRMIQSFPRVKVNAHVEEVLLALKKARTERKGGKSKGRIS